MIVHQIRKSLVSVIIPAFNAERYIGEAVESALSQTYPEIEIIVIDDGSTDNTVKVVNSFIEKNPKITLLRQEKSGVAAARNNGIRHSRGEFIAPLDADDIWYPDKISKQVRLMRENGPEVGLVYVWNAQINEDSNLIGLGTTARYEADVFAELVIGHFLGSCSSPLIRRECIEKVGGYDTKFYAYSAQGCEDWDLHLRISEHYHFVVVKQLLVGYRQTPNAMSSDHKQMKRSRDLMISLLRLRHPEIPNQLLKWSNSFYHLYLHSISIKKGDIFGSLNYLLKAAWMLPALVLCNDYRRRYNNLARRVVKPLIPQSLLATLRRWRYNEKTHKNYRLADLQKHADRISQLSPGSIVHLRNRLLKISKENLCQTLETPHRTGSINKYAYSERAHKNN